jgi:hypothetical protein
VVPASELADAIKQIRELQQMLGKKTKQVEILQEAVEIARSQLTVRINPQTVSRRRRRVLLDTALVEEIRR